MTSTEISSASKIILGTTEAVAMYIGSEKLWPVLHDYSLDYFTIESLEDSNSIAIERTSSSPGNKNMSYSLDGGVTWTNLTLTYNTSIATINTGDKILFKGTNSSLSNSFSKYWRFTSSKNFNVCGNVMSLLFGDNFINNSEFASGTTYSLNGLFQYTTTLINAKNLILPATTLVKYCYQYMFRGCTSLTTAPSLPATTLAQCCYLGMFQVCTSLTTAPALPATTLALSCYRYMFYGCTSLITAPALPATTLTNYCYGNMFCDCTSLNYIKAMFTTTASDSLYLWVLGVAASGTFVKNSAATWNVTGVSGVPSGWTVLTS